MRVEQRVLDATKFLELENMEKQSILRVLGMVAKSVHGDGDKALISVNNEALSYLLSNNVITWAMMDADGEEAQSVIGEYPEFIKMFESEFSAKKTVKKAEEIGEFKVVEFATVEECLDNISDIIESVQTEDVIAMGDFDESDMGDMENNEFEDEIDENEVGIKEDSPIQNIQVEGYDPEIHGGFKSQIEELLLNTFEEMYGKFFNGQENIDGFIVPSGGLSINKNYQGILRVNKGGAKVTPNTISNAIFEEFYRACKSCGVDMNKAVEGERDKVVPYKYNPMLQLSIADGSMAEGKEFHSWKEYKEFIRVKVMENSQRWAILQANSGSLEPVYREMSGYTMNIMVINYREGLGSQIRFNCGDNSKTEMVAEAFVRNLKQREKTHKALAMGKLLVGDPVVSKGKNCAVVAIYQNINGYQSVPTFMGELLYKMPDGHFKPSIKNMIIGKSLNNEIVTAPLTKWLLPIIAGSRSGKGVLTLNMLLNVVGTGTPLFYLDGKPDMATLLWDMMGRHGIDRGIVVDSVGYEGVTPIDKKPYVAPYKPSIVKSLSREGNSSILESHMTAFIYLKTMYAIYLGLQYYKDKMGSRYGDIFVVLDEMYVTFVDEVEQIYLDIATLKGNKERAEELKNIDAWITGLLNKFSAGDAGIFGAGIKAVALTQWANANVYKTSSTTVNTFCHNFLLRRSVKLYGRQESGGGMYGVSTEKSDPVKFDLYDKYYHFGVGVSTGNNYNTLKTFKPLLVLNENDCMELTGKNQDGVFIGGVVDRIADYVNVPEFRHNNFSDKEFARSIGFEGALEQVGRLTGNDWKEMMKLSMTRAYDILDEALRYYGLVGVNDVDNVYDFITDARISSLKPVSDVIKETTKKQSEEGSGEETVEYSANMLGGVYAAGDDEKIPFDGNGKEPESSGYEEVPEQENTSKPQEMSREQQEFYKRRLERDARYRGGSVPPVQKEEVPIHEERRVPVHEEDVQENVIPFKPRVVETKPEEVFHYGNERPAFEREGNIIRLTREISENEGRVDFTKENYRGPLIDRNHPVSRVSEWFGNTSAGARYELKSRFKFIMDRMDEVVKPNMVTRMIIGEEEISLNGVFIDVSGMVGGQGEARLCDVISFAKILKKYKNLKELSIDRSMLEAMRYEFRNIPNDLFIMNKFLQVIVVMDAAGNREVMKRGESSESQMVKKAEASMEFEAMCDRKNPRINEKTSAAYSSVRRGLMGYSKKGASSFIDSLTSKDKSMGKGLVNGVASVGLFGLGMVVSVPYGISKLGKLFKN